MFIVCHFFARPGEKMTHNKHYRQAKVLIQNVKNLPSLWQPHGSRGIDAVWH
jgi:hypothetical protein